MEMQEQLSNDAVPMAIVEPAPRVVSTTIGDGDDDGEATGLASSPTSFTASNVISCSSPCSASKKIDRELRQPFPVKVYEMLEDADEKQFSHIVSWNADGTGFMVHSKDHFTKEIVPHYFNLTKYKSFQRQLSLYGFQRVTVGPNKGLRYHGKLRKGELELVRQMKPVGYKPRNLTRLLEQQKQKQQMGTTTMTTTTTTVVKTTTTSTTSTTLVNDPSNDTSSTSTSTCIPNTIEKLAEYPRSDDSRAMDAAAPDDSMTTTIIGNSRMPDAYNTTIPPVVSSCSLIKQDQEPSSEENQQQQQQHLEQNNHVHAISPETTIATRYPIHLQGSGGYCDSTACGQVWNKQDNKHEKYTNQGGATTTQPEIIVDFEGMCFHLMSPTRDLGINVKLKLLEEFNPSSSLLQLASKYATAGYTISKPQTTPATANVVADAIPVTIDAVQERPSLPELTRCNNVSSTDPFTDVVIAAAAAAATASNIAALQSAAAAAGTAVNTLNKKTTSATTASLLSSPKSDGLETRCMSMDALDFHAINITTRI